MNQILNQDYLRSILDYDPESGCLTWKKRYPHQFEDKKRSAESSCVLWNARYAGKSALSLKGTHGYKIGKIHGVNFQLHRVAWVWMTGEVPNQIDHINGIRSDNRWSNLRDVSLSENNKNRRIQKNNTSGVHGVSFYQKTGKWVSRIKINRERIHLGYFDSFEEACQKRKEAETFYGFHQNHGK